MPKTYLRKRNHKFANPRQGSKKASAGNANELQVLSVRIEPDVKDRMDLWIAKTGWTKKQAVMFALEFMMAEYSPSKARSLEPK